MARSCIPNKPNLPSDAGAWSIAAASKPTAIVFHNQRDVVGPALEQEADPFGVGVAEDVGERLARDAVKGGLHFPRQAPRGHALAIKVHRHAAQGRPFVRVTAQRHFQAEVIQRGRAQFPGQAMQVPHQAVGQVFELADALAQRRRAGAVFAR